MLKVGLTGGIGAGKSAVATRLAAHGALIVDADRLAREVVTVGTDGLAEVVEAFGREVLAADGSLDRPALGARVFADPDARARLEAIVHPRVRRRTVELTAAAPADAVVVNDVPLLVETGQAPAYHLVVVVSAAEWLRVDRLTRDRGMSRDAAQARIRAQADDAQRAAAADVLLDNDGSRDDLAAAVDRLWHDRLVPYEANLRAGRPAPRPTLAVLADPDPTWPVQFDRIAARIRHAVGADRRVDHVGSTAVPGFPAKDVIDVQLTVDSLDDADGCAAALAAAGFPRPPGDWWDSPKPDPGTGRLGEPWPKRLHGNADPGRAVNLHVRVGGSPGWRYALALRDHLRVDAAQRADYLAVKRRIAATGPTTREYAAAKEPWFDQAWPRLLRWIEETGWQP
ncbi:dephospho-CoA kinase [Micromonospora sp. NBC_01813]|uniref:dephospho-CoA kinase n=1 Tax=Micromonospora sp. NBC_01813 TaxID=2975988 RepID=UPI002DDC7443|nr:dephospho-CoA kinase [Micromonospora sp. NBC_01813]WSA09828.1 dephospho-CoA kinase [Micromonospora sp. NBC_01813]